jgi:kynureninase
MDSITRHAAVYPTAFQVDESFALGLDAADPLKDYRARFHLPQGADGKPVIYFCTHSLGLQPTSVPTLIAKELDQWARRGVEGHFEGEAPWYTYPELLRDPMARIVGAKPSEVVVMNGLTVNLHLMMATFYRPDAQRHKILMEEPTFPSDLYAIKSQLRQHGFNPSEALLTIKPRHGQHAISTEEILDLLEVRGKETALVLISGVNFLTGQRFDMARIAAAARRQGCVVGFDLAHAAGNVVLHLHEWQADFAVWCTYKYLNSGPGAVGGCFVHEKHGRNIALPRLAGWWGNDPDTRFRMQLQPEFIPQFGADGWQVSNPPILALAPIRASMALFDEVGMPALRAKSECLTAYLLYLLDQMPAGYFDIITPRDPAQRGCQLSLLVRDHPKERLRALADAGVVGDFREPNVIRIAPVPLYNTFHEVWRFAQILGRHVA